MKERLFGGTAHRAQLRFALSGPYIAAEAVTLAALFVGFVDEQFGCPPGFHCGPITEPLLAPRALAIVDGQDGVLLVVLGSLALVVGLVSAVRRVWPLLATQLALALTILALVSWDAVDPQERVVGLPWYASHPPFWLSSAAGFYLALVSSATGAAVALLLLANHLLQQRGRRWSLREAPA